MHENIADQGQLGESGTITEGKQVERAPLGMTWRKEKKEILNR